MTDLEIIQAFGGAASLSRQLNIKPAAIAYWKRKGIPELRRIQLQSLRPDLFHATNAQTLQPAATPTSD